MAVNCHRVIVIGRRNDVGYPRQGELAQGEIDPGKQGLPSQDDPIKQNSNPAGGPTATPGPFKNGVYDVQGTWNMDYTYGVLEFNCLASAEAWLGTPAGDYFKSRFDDIKMFAAAACY